jgi:hypothetical protein
LTTLAARQRDFLEALFAEDASAPAGLAVYRRNVRANFRVALAATYPVVQRLVGGAFFAAAAERFASEHPSRSGDLGEFGAELASFLERYAPAAALAYLPDVARLEWACHESEHAADAPVLDARALAQVPARGRGAIRLRLHPAVRLLHSSHPVCAIWEANQAGRDGTPRRTEGEEFALVRRDGFAVRVEALGRGEFEFLARVREGATLEHAGSAMSVAELQRFLAPALARYAASGVVAGFDAPEGDA